MGIPICHLRDVKQEKKHKKKRAMLSHCSLRMTKSGHEIFTLLLLLTFLMEADSRLHLSLSWLLHLARR